MTTVTFPTAYNGSGATVSDEGGNPNTLLNGGHRQLFTVALQGTIDMAAWTKLKADETNADRTATQSNLNQAIAARNRSESASVTAVNASNTAVAASDSASTSAELAAQNASGIYASVALGLSNTTNGQYFKVPEQSWVQLYRNDSGSAFPVMRLASQEELERLNTRLDPLLTTLVFS